MTFQKLCLASLSGACRGYMPPWLKEFSKVSHSSFNTYYEIWLAQFFTRTKSSVNQGVGVYVAIICRNDELSLS